MRLLDAGILLVTVLIGLFAFSLSTRIGYSHSEERQPPIVVRTQVLNACGRHGLAARTAGYLQDVAVGRIRFDVVDVGNFVRTNVRRSFVINYSLTEKEARSIADALDIGPLDVVESDAGLTDLGYDISLVLGSEAVEPEAETPDKDP